jgi:formylglycine-generating enzyme required for sulfatase activity
MKAISDRYNYLFRSTIGLALVAIAMISLSAALFGMLAPPMAELGLKDLVVRTFGLRLIEAEREGRIIMLYHSIAMAVIAIQVYFITALVKMKPHEQSSINATVTFGYLFSIIFGLWFGYFGHNFIFHGLFLFGQSLMFFGGILLAAALWPWRKENLNKDGAYSHLGGLSLERTAFFVMAVATLGSAIFGAIPGSFFGNGFNVFLAEDTIREVNKTVLQKSIIGHLHIMLTLIGIATALIIGRWFDFKGILHKMAMPMMILGTIVISIGAWSVTVTPSAHTIIYVGSVFVLLPGLFLVIFGWNKLIRTRLAEQGIVKANIWQALKALVHDPLRFGALWQMVFMNFTVSGVGIFMAATLTKIIRVWPWREERITLTGHWHILATLIATILLFYFADQAGLKGRARNWFGWLIIIGSNVAFASVTIFSLKRLFVDEAAQQPLVNWTMLLADIGLATILVVLALFMVWRLVDLFNHKGKWKAELAKHKPLLLLLLAFGLVSCGIMNPAIPSTPPPSIETRVDSEAWALVPSGPFLMGQKGIKTEIEDDYEIMVTHVTNSQYARYLTSALESQAVSLKGDEVVGFYPGDEFRAYKHEQEITAGEYLHISLSEPGLRLIIDGLSFSSKTGYENHPMVQVTWFGAKSYCEYYGWRLPNEIEWEKAARGLDGWPFPWGEEIVHNQANFYNSKDIFENVAGKLGDTTPVGFYNGGKHSGYQTIDSPSPYGLYDMAGNVWQWTDDVYPGTHYRYLRGGSKENYPHDLRVWTRNSATPTYYSPNVGFRCVRDSQ